MGHVGKRNLKNFLDRLGRAIGMSVRALLLAALIGGCSQDLGERLQLAITAASMEGWSVRAPITRTFRSASWGWLRERMPSMAHYNLVDVVGW